MRGNNIPFSHATAFHEMIPGHNMQRYIGRASRPSAATPEAHPSGARAGRSMGDLSLRSGFRRHARAADRDLFWRMHRCARIVYSMKIPTGTVVTPGMHRLSRRDGRPRMGERHGRSPPLFRRRIRPPLSGGLPDRSPPDPRIAQGIRGLRDDDRQGLPRRHNPDGRPAITLVRLALGRQKLGRT